MYYFYLAARALPTPGSGSATQRIGVSGTDTVRGGRRAAARWRRRLTVESPARWLSMTFVESDHVLHACMPALTQRPLHTVMCNQKENNFVKY